MKTLELNQMEVLNGGRCSSSTVKALAVIGMVATIGSFFGPVGWIIAGPSAIGVGIGGLICAFN